MDIKCLVPVELIEDYWIIQDPKTFEEYLDYSGENLVFESKDEAEYFIKNLRRDF